MSTVVFRPRCAPLAPPESAVPPDPLDPGALLARLRGRRGLVALDSGAGSGPCVIGFDPVGAPFEVPAAERGDWLGALRRLLERFVLDPDDPGDAIPGPFHGGFLGALSYDLGVPGERAVAVPPAPFGLPLTAGGLYVDFLVRPAADEPWWLVLGERPGDGRPPVAERRAQLEALLSRSETEPGFAAEVPRRRVESAEHRRRIEVVRERIAAGEVYQANLAHPFECATRGDPLELYRALRRVNPAPYMGYCALEGADGGTRGALLSASPELLLEFDGELVRTRPIKGTAPRGASPEEDAALAAALLASEKDRAELVMIVDLERNDLGRIAAPGGVWVEGFPSLDSYAQVHHLMADVVARPAPGVGALEALGALFPGGSVTGAPKLAAMDLIAELEGEGRGFFCGALGFVDGRGRAAFNLLIRTLEWRPGERRPGAGPGSAHGDGQVSFRVGGGITFASDAADEDRETLAKARGLLEALGARSGEVEGPGE